jgi:type II secretory pathway component PulF
VNASDTPTIDVVTPFLDAINNFLIPQIQKFLEILLEPIYAFLGLQVDWSDALDETFMSVMMLSLVFIILMGLAKSPRWIANRLEQWQDRYIRYQK